MGRTAAPPTLLYLLSAVLLGLCLTCVTCRAMDIDPQDTLATLMKQCEAVDDYASPYVLAFSARRPQVFGCETSNRASTPAGQREVHVINVKRGVTRVDGAPPHVTLRLEPASSTGIHQGPLVVVLVAPSPVVWRVGTQRLSNQSRIIFWIQDGSCVVKLNQLRHKVKTDSLLPSDGERLMQWVSEKYRALTSYTETQHINTITRRVGTGRRGPERCVPTENFESPNTEVTSFDPQPTHACSVSKNEGIMAKDIHVLELVAPANSSGRPREVVLGISMTTRETRKRHLLLLLKGPRDVTWRVHATGMRGVLDITAQMDNHVTTVVNPKQTVRQTMEQLDAYSGAGLRQWVINKEGPIVSYTRVDSADTLNLVIDGTAGGRTHTAITTPSGNGRVPNKEEEKESDDQFVINRSPFLTPAKTREALIRARDVHCTSRSMEVLLKKRILRLHGIRQEHLSLLAPECIALANQTHYILHTELDTCGTDGKYHDNSVTYQNAILLHDVDLSDVTDDLGSADLRELSSLLASTDHTRIDDEDYETTETNGQIRVDFRCNYPIGNVGHNGKIESEVLHLNPNPRNASPQVGDRQFTLAVYSSRQYAVRYQTWPLRLTRDSLIFLEAGMSGDDNLHLILQNCWVSATRFRKPNGHRLIDNGCEQNGDVMITETTANRVRFSFRYRETLSSVRAFVGCQLAVCARDESAGAERIPLCSPRNCEHSTPRPGSAGQETSVNVCFTGPLDPPNAPSDQENKGGENRTPQDPAEPRETSKQCQEVIRVEGLDSGTVVGISFAAFIIGILLTAALWVIHTHTGPYRAANRPRSTETSGESTPSSTAPITIHHIHT